MISAPEFEELSQLYEGGFQNLDFFSQEAASARIEYKARILKLYDREFAETPLPERVPFEEFRASLADKIKAFLKKRARG
jgi:hypothetical protein